MSRPIVRRIVSLSLHRSLRVASINNYSSHSINIQSWCESASVTHLDQHHSRPFLSDAAKKILTSPSVTLGFINHLHPPLFVSYDNQTHKNRCEHAFFDALTLLSPSIQKCDSVYTSCVLTVVCLTEQSQLFNLPCSLNRLRPKFSHNSVE